MKNLMDATRKENLGESRNPYDKFYKMIFSKKEIISVIIKNTVPEFSNLSIEEIVRLMKGNIKRGVSVRESDEIIQKKQGEEPISEKSIYYDLRFEIQSPKRGKKNRLVFLQFDVEFQSTMPTTYKIGQRMSYYIGRMQSAKLSELKKTIDYQNLEKVYSIWIFDKPKNKEMKAGIVRYKMRKEEVVGTVKLPDDLLDYMEVIVIQKGRDDTNSEIFELLKALDARDVDILKKYVTMEIEDKTIEAEGGDSMLNPWDRGYEVGKEEGKAQGVEIGRFQEHIESRIQAVGNIMETMGLSFERAIAVLKIDEKDIPIIKERMKEKILN